jgi:RNA 2',3'-cyclic 3'-phosphodiesterase
VRAFIAVDFPPNILKKIADITAFFKTLTPEKSLKWVETNNLHLTIKFLGEIEENIVAQVKLTLSQALMDHNCFDIEINGLGMYPNKNNPKVIWLGITGTNPLTQIYKVLNRELTALDIPPERRAFSPHLTIARLRRHTDHKQTHQIGEILSGYKVDSLGATTIDQVHLYQSVLTPSGPIYTLLHSVALNQV